MAFSTGSALKVLLNSINIHFDHKLVQNFINYLGPLLNNKQSFYAVNDICELNTRELAVIRSMGTDDLLKPSVMIFCRFERQQGKLAVKFYDKPVDVDLKEDRTRHMTKILDNSQQLEIIKHKLVEKNML